MTIKSFFTPDEQKQILTLRDSGFSIKRIANEVHRSRVNIAIFLNSPEEYKKLMKSYMGKEASMSSSALSGTSSSAVKSGIITPKKKVITKKKPLSTPAKAKTPKKFSKKTATITSRDVAVFNKVILEHRCVIKFLTKLGENVSSIYGRLKVAYAPMHPEMPAVKYWAVQFKKGRQTILNDPQTVRELSKSKKMVATSTKIKSKSSTGSSNGVKKVKKTKSKSTKPVKPVATKNGVANSNGRTEEIRAEAESVEKEKPAAAVPVKKIIESSGTFTIKLPGMDRLSKTLSN